MTRMRSEHRPRPDGHETPGALVDLFVDLRRDVVDAHLGSQDGRHAEMGQRVERHQEGPAAMLGIMSGIVIFRVIVKSPAPEIRADSSRVGSIRSSAPETWMKTKGNRYIVSTAMIPPGYRC